MALDLNEIIAPYEEFYGRTTEQMPLLIAKGRQLMSVAGVMERRINSDKKDWKGSYFFTGDAVAYHPDKKFKIVSDAEILRNLNAESKLESGALILPEGMYETLEGEEFLYKNVQKLLEKELSQADVLKNPLWKAVARDQALLEEYVPRMFAEMKKSFDYEENMGIYLDSFDKPKLRALVVYGLGIRSMLYGGNYLGIDGGRLVGVAPEALNAHGKVIVKPSLETALNVVNEHMQKSGILLKTK